MIAVIDKIKTGIKIETVRKSKNYELEEVVNSLGIKNYEYLEKGKKKPTIKELLSLSNLFEVSINELIEYRIED